MRPSKRAIKPILGCELYVCKAEDHRADAPNRANGRLEPSIGNPKGGNSRGSEYNHLLVLAENEEGYRNLIRLTSEASLHGFYRRPRVSKKYLAENSKGLICLSGCLSGELCEDLLAGRYEKARSVAAQYQEIFGKGNFFLEIQDQGLEDEKKIHEALFRLERELEIPLVATNDSHYLCGEDSHAHDVMLCVQTGAKIHDEGPLPVRQRPVFCEGRGRDGAAVQGFAGGAGADHGDCRALQPEAAQGGQSVSASSRCRRATPSTATSRRCAARATRSGWRRRCGGWRRRGAAAHADP